MKSYLLFLAAIFFSCSLLRAAPQPFIMPLEQSGASVYNGPFSFLYNPVFSADDAMPYFSYRYMSALSEAKSPGNHRALLSLGGFSFSYSYMDHVLSDSGPVNAGAHVMNISKGFMAGRYFGFGLGYSFGLSNSSLYNGYGGWNFGILVRPWKYISLGVSFLDNWSVIDNKSVDSRQIFSAAVKPGIEWLSLSVDAVKYSNLGIAEMTWLFGVSAALPAGVDLYFKMDFSLNMYFGLTASLNIASKDVSSLSAEARGGVLSGKHGLYSAGISFSSQHYENAPALKVKSRMLTITLKGAFPENQQHGFLGRKYVHLDLLRTIRHSADDVLINGIILKIDSSSFGLAQIQEIRAALKYFKSRNKKVYAFMINTGNKEYYLASAADEILLAPNTTFKLPGLKMKVYFFKKLLDSAGITVESFEKGKYKSFNHGFTREKMSEHVKKNYQFLLDDLTGQFVSDVSQSRKLSKKDISQIFQKGLLTPSEAVKNKLVDSVVYYDDFLKAKKNIITVPFSRYISDRPVHRSWGTKPVISVVYVEGSIIHGTSSSFLQKTTGDETFIKQLRSAARTSSAIVIRINSGGGSALASDYMWRAVKKLSESYKKPLVISFGNIAASGGYYLACGGQTIFSSDATVTGSIGVVLGKLSLNGLYKQLGISAEVIKNTPFSDIFSEHRSLTENEKKLFIKERDFIYDRFTGSVMKSRKIKKENIEKIAGGRVFTGRHARKNRLVDNKGGLMSAILFARAKAEISGPVLIKEYPDRHKSLSEIFSAPETGSLEENMQHLLKYIKTLTLSSGYVQTVMPYRLVIE